MQLRPGDRNDKVFVLTFLARKRSYYYIGKDHGEWIAGA